MADSFDAFPAVDFTQPVLGGTTPTPREAKDIGDAVISGLQSSSMGLIVRGKLPDMQLPASAPWYQRAAAGSSASGGTWRSATPSEASVAASGAPGQARMFSGRGIAAASRPRAALVFAICMSE